MEQENKKEKWFIHHVIDVLKYKRITLKTPERMVLMIIASYANKNGVCSLFLDDIAFFMGTYKTNVSRYIKVLKDKKIITVETQFTEGKRCMTKSKYMINIKALIDLSLDKDGSPIISGSRHVEVTLEPILEQNKDIGHINMMGGSHQYDGVKLISNQQATKLPILDIVRPGSDDSSGSALVPFTFDLRFEEFWLAYPRKEKRKESIRIWRRDKLDKVANLILDDIRQRRLKHDRWQNLTYIPLPSTYLNQESWNDEIIEGVKHEEVRRDPRVQRESRRVEAIRKGFDEYDESMRRIREAEGLS